MHHIYFALVVTILLTTVQASMTQMGMNIVCIKFANREISVYTGHDRCTPTSNENIYSNISKCGDEMLLQASISPKFKDGHWKCITNASVCISGNIWKSRAYVIEDFSNNGDTVLYSGMVATIWCVYKKWRNNCVINVYKERDDIIDTNIKICDITDTGQQDQTISHIPIYLVSASITTAMVLFIALVLLLWKVCEMRIEKRRKNVEKYIPRGDIFDTYL